METPIRLSSDQKEAFERDGFLLLPGFLSNAEVDHYLSVVDRLDTEFREEKSLAPDQTVEIRNAISRAPELLDLISHPVAVGSMIDILGWNIQLTTSHVFVRVPTPGEAPSFKAIGWHPDGPVPRAPTVETEYGVTEPRLYAKIGYFLTDLSVKDSGNLRVVPGSHRAATMPPLDESGEPIGAIQIQTKPGDAVLFENRCWHAVGPNYAGVPRKNIYIGYCHRWMKAIDFSTQSEELLAQANPIQKQLLGAATDDLSFYLPGRTPEDVPLKEFA
jgi:ectoine hydroxylase